jgi:ribonuclease HI
VTASHSNQVVTIYTDGACIGNPGPGGWAAILLFGEHRRETTGAYRNTTNNRMELWAAINALEVLKRPYRVCLVTDSRYLLDGATVWSQTWRRNGWKQKNKEPVKNADLWIRLLQAIERHAPAGGVEWAWTRGHEGDGLNERADALAVGAARRVTDADTIDTPLDTGQWIAVGPRLLP